MGDRPAGGGGDRAAWIFAALVMVPTVIGPGKVDSSPKVNHLQKVVAVSHHQSHSQISRMPRPQGHKHDVSLFLIR